MPKIEERLMGSKPVRRAVAHVLDEKEVERLQAMRDEEREVEDDEEEERPR